MIKTNIKVTNTEITPEIRLYLDRKLKKIGEFVENDQDELILRVEIGRTTDHHKLGEVYRAQIQMYFMSKELRAESRKEDLFQAIDEAKDELLREIKKVKGKSDAITKKGGRMLKNLLRKFYK